ncbi:MAG: DUF6384 family protein [Robiginitomaculum sp.]|nr:DUF6384 family protein [Robiginitomaculum sp.]
MSKDQQSAQVQLSDFGVGQEQAVTAPKFDKRKLDDVMLAMDVVDTLRNDAVLLEKDLSAPEREQQLIDRLRVIYKNQGIEVPDRILREGVRALDDHRFAYEPVKGGFLSKAYINRSKWGKPVMIGLGMIVLAVGLEYALIEVPKKNALVQAEQQADARRSADAAEAKRLAQALGVEIPKALSSARDRGVAIAKTSALKAKVNALYNGGLGAVNAGDEKAAKQAVQDIKTLSADMNNQYQLRIVSRPGENSGVFRLHDNNPNVRNYYLIVEGIGANGKPQMITIESEEDRVTKRTNIWGVRVSKDVFYRVVADKKDDQIIQNAVIGNKKRGYLKPDYSIKTSGGLIVEW